MKKILLMGNPNVGKSAVFSRLTGVYALTSNYPGTTVEFTEGHMPLGGDKVKVIDVPGAYTLEATCKAEEIAVKMLNDSDPNDIIINVIDATNLERNLSLTLELTERKLPLIIALNMWDDTQHRGIAIHIAELQNWLGVPVVPTVGVTGEGIKQLVSRIPEAKIPRIQKYSRPKRWEEIGKVITRLQTLTHRHHTWLEILQDLSIRPISGFFIAATVAFLSFTTVRFIGEGLISYIAEPLFNRLLDPLLMKLSILLGSGGFIHAILIGKLINGQIDFVQSFGLLTTAIYVPLAMVLPYVIAFYFVLGFLEDFGYLPRVAVLADHLMHRVGLHGYAIIPTLLGFGCNVPGIMATRILESRRERFIAATLISIGVPCAALQAMIIGILGKYGLRPVAIVYLTLFLTWLLLGSILNRSVHGFSPELLIEIPPYRIPPWKTLLQKLWMRIVWFLKEAIPIVIMGVFIVNILYIMGIFDQIAIFTAPVVTRLFGLPKEAISAIVIGFLRKDVAVGMLVPLNLTVKQLIVSCTVLAMFFPCIATFTILARELGLKDMLKAALIMVVVSILVGYILNLLL